jgi:hypothetical protein
MDDLVCSPKKIFPFATSAIDRLLEMDLYPKELSRFSLLARVCDV